MNEKKIARWEPFRDLMSMRDDFDRLFEGFFGRMPVIREDFWTPSVDIVENNGNIEVKAEIPGMKKEDIKVTVRDNVLSIAGERRHEKEKTNVPARGNWVFQCWLESAAAPSARRP